MWPGPNIFGRQRECSNRCRIHGTSPSGSPGAETVGRGVIGAIEHGTAVDYEKHIFATVDIWVF